MKDCIIIGAGPAGLTAGIYGMRAGMDLLILEKLMPGGQVMTTFEIENYPGFAEPVQGFDLMSSMEQQVRRLGAEIESGEVISVEKDENTNSFKIKMVDDKILEARTIIAATGASLLNLNVPGEKKFRGRGVSYCATCDAAFFKGKVTAVVGGGNTALEEAVLLTRFASKVYLVHRRDAFRGLKLLQKRVVENENIEIVYDTIITEINGEDKLESVIIKNVKTGEESKLAVDGVFIFVGYHANTTYLPKVILNKWDEVMIDCHMQTPIEGLFAAGDLRQDSIRQIVAATADGAVAALSAYKYIESLEQ